MDSFIFSPEITNYNIDTPETLLSEDLSKRRILVFNGMVDDNLLDDYVLHILNWNAKDEEMNIPIESRTPIKLYINSPGGDCFAGMMLIDVITTSKTPIIGIGFSLVGSMAYHIYLSCPVRYAFSNTIFCQHEGDIEISNSTSKAKDIMAFFDEMNGRLKEHVLTHTKITEEEYDKRYEQEYYFYADSEGKNNGVVNYIIGKDCQLRDIL